MSHFNSSAYAKLVRPVKIIPEILMDKAPCQYTYSKTKACFEWIKQLNTPHAVHIFFTNINLVETLQLANRAKAEGFIPVIISGQKTGYNMNVKDIKLAYHEAEHPPDIIVCCNNISSKKKILELMSTLKHKQKQVYLYYDETDANKMYTTKCIYALEEYYFMIKKIVFITATFYETSVNWYKYITGRELKMPQVHYELEKYDAEMAQESCETYRRIQDHTFLELEQEHRMNVVEYNELAIQTYSSIFTTGVVRVLSLGGQRCDTHEGIINAFRSIGYCGIFINGTIKGGYYIYPTDNTRHSLLEFAQRNDCADAEMYDLLKIFYEKHAEMSTIITGCRKTNRGVTFQSTGSGLNICVSDNSGTTELNRQFLGRMCGADQYVDKATIITTKEKNECMTRIENVEMEQIMNPSPTFTDQQVVNNPRSHSRSQTLALGAWDTQEEAREAVKELLGTEIRKNHTGNATKAIMERCGGRNPTYDEYLTMPDLTRLANGMKARMSPLCDGRWMVVYKWVPVLNERYAPIETTHEERCAKIKGVDFDELD